jgi:hypothetical protein
MFVSVGLQPEQQGYVEASVFGDAAKGKRRMSFWGQKQDDDRCISVQEITGIANVSLRQ